LAAFGKRLSAYGSGGKHRYDRLHSSERRVERPNSANASGTSKEVVGSTNSDDYLLDEGWCADLKMNDAAVIGSRKPYRGIVFIKPRNYDAY
jgi:hypothetical protein